MATKAELIIAALQERIGQMSSQYETQIAILRAEVTQLSDELNKKDNVQKENTSENSN